MLTIGIELNHVVRDINRQIIKYYDKAYNKGWDLDEIDTDDNVYKHISFNSKKENNDFFFIDYPYEIYGCAETCERSLAVKINNWLVDLEEIEDEDIRVVFYSMNEENIALQSTYFFLSKIGVRVRKMMFPKDMDEVWNECDVIVTANGEWLEDCVPQGKKVVLINKPFNDSVKEKAYANYDSLSEFIEDNNFLSTILKDEDNE